jgi:zinc protease
VESSRLIFSRIRAAYLLCVLVLAGGAATARLGASVDAARDRQAPAVPPAVAIDLNAPLPLDASIRTGTLPNGLTYFIRRNARPEKRAMLRLAVQAGSIDEADDQRGLAHMLEHMAFNGGAHFKPGELVSYLESIGARFGPHVNAYTSFDETVYMLDVPTDRAGVLSRGFEALGDFAGGSTLTDQEIDKERGVVLEEWRGRLGAGTRMQQAQMDVIFGPTNRYAQRLPIGLPETIRTFKADRLRDFYRTHYRPDRMAVIVVGDIEPDAIRKLIEANFGNFKNQATVAHAKAPVAPHTETRYLTQSDPETTSSSVQIIHKRPLQQLRTGADYRRLLTRSLLSQMWNARFSEMARAASEPPFLSAGAGGGSVSRDVESFDVQARVKDGGIEKGLAAIAAEIKRVKAFGFNQSELDRAKASLLARYERLYTERDKQESDGFASELITYYLTSEAAPGIESELRLARQIVPAITLANVAALAKELLPETNRVVIATAPQKEGLTPVTQAALRDALASGAAATVTAWRDEVANRELLAKAPTAGRVTGRREIPEIGVTVVTLSNGVNVWLKPTDFRNDQITFTSFARGGISVAGEENFQNAALSTGLVGLGGVGGFTPTEMGKLLAGKLASASPYISTYTQGVQGNASPKDLETALQLAYLDFTAPNKDPGAFQQMKRRLEAQVANRGVSPGQVFGERVAAINTMNHYTSRPLQAADIGKLDPEAMMKFYQDRFANAANFTFFFVGAFKVDEITPLLSKYLGALPSNGAPDSQAGALKMQFPAQVVTDRVTKGKEPRSQTVITYFADASNDEIEAHRLRAATTVLQNRLRDILREELGGTYSVGAGYGDNAPEGGYGTTTIQFGSSPENVSKLTDAVLKELDRLRREGPSEADVNAVKETEKNDLQEQYKTNSFWLGSLQTAAILGRDPKRIALRIERTESLTAANIHQAFMKYFPPDRYTIVTLVPDAATN